MSDKVIWIFFIAVITFFVAVILLSGRIGFYLKEDMSATKTAVLKSEFLCPEGCKETSEPWGESGYSRYCVKGGKRHGKWVGWERQKLSVEGYYLEGKEDGYWTWYHNDGRVYRIIEYRGGMKIRDRIINR